MLRPQRRLVIEQILRNLAVLGNDRWLCALLWKLELLAGYIFLTCANQRLIIGPVLERQRIVLVLSLNVLDEFVNVHTSRLQLVLKELLRVAADLGAAPRRDAFFDQLPVTTVSFKH